MTAARVSPWFRRVLVVVAHEDDETACSVLLQRLREVQIVFATDGAPTSEFFWHNYGSRQLYAAVRRAEAIRSLKIIGLENPIFLQDSATDECFRDQELHRFLEPALQALIQVAEGFKPDALLAPAYEGGHPDHDVCSFLVYKLGELLSLPKWEMPLYYRSPEGILVHQEFRVPFGGEVLLYPTELELQRRDQMVKEYISQPDASRFVCAHVERFRPQPVYNYSRSPHPGTLNYEFWGWPATGKELCTAFERFQTNGITALKKRLQDRNSWDVLNLSTCDGFVALQS